MKNKNLLFVGKKSLLPEGIFAKKCEDLWGLFLQLLHKWILLNLALKYQFHKQNPHNAARRHDITQINIFRKNIVSESCMVIIGMTIQEYVFCKYFQYKILKFLVVYHIRQFSKAN